VPGAVTPATITGATASLTLTANAGTHAAALAPSIAHQAALTKTADATTIGPTGITTTTGNGLLIAVAMRLASDTVTGVVDSAGNTWAQLLAPTIASGMTLSVWGTTNANPTGLSAGSITASFSSCTVACQWFEIANGNPAAQVDKSHSTAVLSSSAPSSGATGTLTATNERALGILAFAAVRTLSATPTFTQGIESYSWPSSSGINSSTGSSQVNLHAGTLLITSTTGQGYSGTISSASAWCAVTLVLAG